MPFAVLLLVSAITGWTESLPYRRLFTPAAVPDGTYRTFVSPRPLDEVLADVQPGAEPRAVVAAEAFGQSVFLFVEPALEAIREEPRFKALLARLSGLRSPKAQHD